MGMTPNELHFIQDSFREIKSALLRIESKVDHQDQCTDELKVIVESNALKDDARFEKLAKDMLSIVPNGDFPGHCNWHAKRIEFTERLSNFRWKFILKFAELSAAGIFGWISLSAIVDTINFWK